VRKWILEETVMSKYKEVTTFLSRVPTHLNEFTLSFEQINQIIDASKPLPDSAYDHRQWWENQTDNTDRPQAKAWMDAGFKVDDVEQDDGWVRFKRV
jgi:hypothetical protein